MPVAATTEDSAAFWLYSSGTTGMPKGVINTHGNPRPTVDTYATNVLEIAESVPGGLLVNVSRGQLLDEDTVKHPPLFVVNLRHYFFSIQAVAPAMLAAKSGVEGITHTMARTFGEHEIRVNTTDLYQPASRYAPSGCRSAATMNRIPRNISGVVNRLHYRRWSE